jgi:transmembrane sensor
MWLARLDAGAAPEDQQELLQWLAEDPSHMDVLMEMAALWDQMSMLTELSELFPLKTYSNLQESRLRRRQMMTAVGATAFGGLVLGGFSFMGLRRGGFMTRDVKNSYLTAIGELKTVVLPDGSELMLNTNTLVEVIYADHKRNIFLQRGECLFTVAKDAARPFRVFAGSRVVEAIGTAFTVQRTEQNTLEVLVTEGKVNFFQLNEKVEPKQAPPSLDPIITSDDVLVAGEYAATKANTGETVEKRRVQREEMDVRLAWQHGMLLFQSEPLERVLREVSRYTTIRLETDENVRGRNIQVNGYYRAGDVDSLLVAMQRNFKLNVKYVGKDHILLTAQ